MTTRRSLPFSVPRPTAVAGVALTALLVAGCGGESGSAASFTIERGGIDRGLDGIVSEAVGDGSPAQGAPLEACPILEEGDLVDAAEVAGVEVDIEESVRGFASVNGAGVAVNCDFGGLTVTVQQTRALDAEEFLQTLFTDVPEAPSYSTGDSFGDLEEGNVFIDEEGAAAGWVDNGIAISVAFPPDRSDVTSDDAGAVLEEVHDDILETLGAAAESGDDFAVPEDDELSRTDIVEAMEEALPEEARGSAQLQALEGTCPVLDEDGAQDLGDRLDLTLSPSVGDTAIGVPNPSVRCRLGDPADQGVALTVALDRPRSVSEFAFRNDSPLNPAAEREVSPLSEGVDGLDQDRTMLLEGEGGPQVGWINNGLTIIVGVPDDADPGAVISETVPLVLASLGLD